MQYAIISKFDLSGAPGRAFGCWGGFGGDRGDEPGDGAKAEARQGGKIEASQKAAQSFPEGRANHRR